MADLDIASLGRRAQTMISAVAGITAEPGRITRLYLTPEHRLAAATRKSMLLLFARAAAIRLQSLIDPAGPYEAMD